MMETIGVIAAMEVEVTALKEKLEDAEISRIAGTEFYTGRIGTHNVVLMRCGIGKVSAALGTQAMITVFHPDYVVNTGAAGAIASGLKIGDIVLSTATAEWDLDFTALGAPRGYVSALDAVTVNANQELRGRILAAARDGCGITEGLVVSGDQFVSTEEQRRIILESFPDAKCAEMEGAAVGHVCAQNGVPFCVLRCMSDTADGDSHVDFAEFCESAGRKSADILLRLMGR